jgi:hypothetical protein
VDRSGVAWRPPETIPRRVFLYGHYYARGFVAATLTAGPQQQLPPQGLIPVAR